MALLKGSQFTMVLILYFCCDFQSRELLNMALLTGTQAVHPMKIFAVSQAGKVEEVTDETTCHSGDENVIKVASNNPFYSFTHIHL